MTPARWATRLAWSALAAAGLCLGPRAAGAQDTAMVQGGIYQRPFLVSLGRTAIGGYAEGNANWFRTDGVSEGLSMELRRFNIFVYSTAGTRLRFASELEFEHGTEEISLETALLDFLVTPSLVFRGGIILPPVGGFNVNHDAPRYEFVERPLVSTRVIPATLSEIGFGVHGRLGRRNLAASYDLYLVNGLGDGVVLNAEGRTHLASGKSDERFAEDNNGSPAVTGRIALRHRRLGEVGASYYGGAYNTFRVEGETVAPARWVSIAALDLGTELLGVTLNGEVAAAWIQVPDDLSEVFGERQWGAYLDAVVALWRPRIRALRDPVIHAAIRLERVDLNVGTFASTGGRIHDEVDAVSVGLGFRPVAGTVIRANYRYESFRDPQGNPAERTGGFQFGFATYF
jgi:hypothetical protein